MEHEILEKEENSYRKMSNAKLKYLDIRAPRKKEEIERFSVSRKFFRFLYDVSSAFSSQYFLYKLAKEKLGTKALEYEVIADVLQSDDSSESLP